MLWANVSFYLHDKCMWLRKFARYTGWQQWWGRLLILQGFVQCLQWVYIFIFFVFKWHLRGGNLRNEFIFSKEPLSYNFFFSGRTLKILFFPGECLSKFIFSYNFFFSARTLKILFFPGECLSKFIFSLEKGLRIFFYLDFLRPHPQIINGRPPMCDAKQKWLVSNWNAPMHSTIHQ